MKKVGVDLAHIIKLASIQHLDLLELSQDHIIGCIEFNLTLRPKMRVTIDSIKFIIFLRIEGDVAFGSRELASIGVGSGNPSLFFILLVGLTWVLDMLLNLAAFAHQLAQSRLG
ncbi:hypothetical protein V6N13_007877 [Hibiscus sabdariffa]